MPLRPGRKCGLVCACTLSVPASGCGGGHLRTLVTTLWQLSLQIGRTSRGQGTSSCLQTLASPRLPEQPLSPLLCSTPNNDRHRNSSVPCSLRGSAMCLCTMSTLQYLLTTVFSSFFTVFHFKTNNSRPFTFTMEHNHQEISQGEKKNK